MIISIDDSGRCKVLASTVVTSGSVGETISFVLSSAWANYTKTAVFHCGTRVGSTSLTEDGNVWTCEIPETVIARPGSHLMVGVRGVRNGSVITSTLVDAGIVEAGAIPVST